MDDDNFDFADFGMDKGLAMEAMKFVATEGRTETITFLELLLSALSVSGGNIEVEALMVLLESYSAGMLYGFMNRDSQVTKTAEQLFGAKMNDNEQGGDFNAS